MKTKSASCLEDHPRLCGEKALNGFFLTYLLGSPPPMRGKAPVPESTTNSPGITPAYAGKRSSPFIHSCHPLDHPRLCGEKQPPMVSSTGTPGSPPPMRGKGKSSCVPFAVRRITPAYAGKSSLCHANGSNNWDHPRLCGEK